MGTARVRVSAVMMREALSLPRSSEIVFAKMADFDTVELTVTDPGIPDEALPEGAEPQLASPSFRRQAPVEFIEWGIRK